MRRVGSQRGTAGTVGSVARACDRAALPWRVGLAGRGDAGEGKCGFGDGGVDEEQVLRCIDDVVQGEQGTGSRVFPGEDERAVSGSEEGVAPAMGLIVCSASWTQLLPRSARFTRFSR